jgi:hypothetical protein
VSKPIWNSSGAWCWFHYCQPDVAVAIGAAREFQVSPRDDARGNGIHLTNIAPGAKSDDELLKRLFALQRDVSFIEGVVVLRKDDKLLPAARYGRSKWLVPKEKGEFVDLAALYLGHARRDNGIWTYTPGLLE